MPHPVSADGPWAPFWCASLKVLASGTVVMSRLRAGVGEGDKPDAQCSLSRGSGAARVAASETSGIRIVGGCVRARTCAPRAPCLGSTPSEKTDQFGPLTTVQSPEDSAWSAGPRDSTCQAAGWRRRRRRSSSSSSRPRAGLSGARPPSLSAPSPHLPLCSVAHKQRKHFAQPAE